MRATVTVVIANLDGERLLPSCLESLAAALEGIAAEVVVVDNGSRDASIDVVRRVLPLATIIENNANAGFARACNQGAEISDAEFVLFLNNDIDVSENCIRDLLEAAQRSPSGAAWQPRITRASDNEAEPLYSSFTRSGFLYHSSSLPDTADCLHRAFALKGACMLVRKSAFDAVAGFDEAFFAYFEESDLCWRLRLDGWEVEYADVCCARHIGGATSSRIFPMEYLDYLSFRNRLVSILKNAEARTLLTVLPLHLLGTCGVIAVFAATGRWRHSIAVARALAAVIASLPSILQRRRVIQTHRAISDRALLPPLTQRMTSRRALGLMKGYLERVPVGLTSPHDASA